MGSQVWGPGTFPGCSSCTACHEPPGRCSDLAHLLRLTSSTAYCPFLALRGFKADLGLAQCKCPGPWEGIPQREGCRDEHRRKLKSKGEGEWIWKGKDCLPSKRSLSTCQVEVAQTYGGYGRLHSRHPRQKLLESGARLASKLYQCGYYISI